MRKTANKPSIADFFQQGHNVAVQAISKRDDRSTECPSPRSMNSSRCESSGTETDDASLGSDHSWSSNSESPLACAALCKKTVPRQLLLLTPSVTEPQRYSQEGVLGDVESLQLKHSEEYEFLVPAISHALSSVISAHSTWQPRTRDPTNGQSQEQDPFELFGMRYIPDVTLHDYLDAMVRQTYISPSVLVIACLFLDRLLTKYQALRLTMHNIYKLFVVATRVANKVMDTRTLNNKHFATACGISNTELNVLELKFMQLIGLDLHVDSAEFSTYTRDLVSCTGAKSNTEQGDISASWGSEALLHC
ncbi:Cyclin Cyclin N terminal domain [Trypanosoma vivax]|uniref:Cyclin n=1 Tax=Trypanosoma vivax (strain Y486) TaxID=1055687 RepID=G0U1N0_TRYVY|nr:hypothetical protein TRVL_00948 [Trypanosoma vivax]KAH8617053.1 Cyclin Cyclin N terminal domain [Trypanosoma vivax]CCC49987.1 conserved hypothetical protein [Trypanosoma vivax Y486]